MRLLYDLLIRVHLLSLEVACKWLQVFEIVDLGFFHIRVLLVESIDPIKLSSEAHIVECEMKAAVDASTCTLHPPNSRLHLLRILLIVLPPLFVIVEELLILSDLVDEFQVFLQRKKVG